MARCEFCGADAKTRLISGIHFCEACFGDIQKLRNEDPVVISKYLDQDVFTSATPQAADYITNIVSKSKMTSEAARAAAQGKALVASRASSMVLTTCPHVEGHSVTKQFGLVFGETVFKNGFLKSLGASLEDFGAVIAPGDNEASGTMRLIEDARKYAMEKMKNEAAKRGANAIIGIDAESTMGSGGIMHISIWGTAVEIAPIEKSE